MMTKKEILEFIQTAKDLAEEINWSDKRTAGRFENDLCNDLANLYKTLLAINGLQSWEGH